MSDLILTNWSFATLLVLWAICAAMIIFMVLKIKNYPPYKEMVGLQEKIADAEDKLKGLKESIENLAPQVQEFEIKSAQLETLNQEVERVKLELERLEPLKQELNGIEAKYVTKSEELAQKENDIKEKDKELRKIIDEIASKNNEMARKRREQIELKKERAETIEKLDEQIVQRQKEHDDLINECKQLQRSNEILEGKKADIARDIREWAAKKRVVDDKLKRIRNDVTTKSDELFRMKNELNLINRDIEQKTADRVELIKSCKEHEKENRQLRAENKKQWKIASDLDEKNKRLIEKKTELTILAAKLAAIKGELESAGGDGKTDPLEELWHPVFEKKTAAPKRKEEDHLETVSMALEKQGLIYHTRVLHAFHTALKSSAISPLVVLAGISGTGKSLLPRMYAKYMGMHFLGIAVQARWDSPQDMFGFYNYMERKYKSTELARAMLQFEQFNRNAFDSSCVNLSDQMMLVLLDEMNMSRIEYYFSEFISKLENRRDIDPGIAQRRKDAEIILDVGHRKVDSEEIRIFPGENVLFTGTMNEDESTQSLSDKVIDRASVLRFGKPATLDVEDQEPDNNVSVAPLAYATWKDWKTPNPISAGEMKKVQEEITLLLDAMDSIGRPFAYRVRNAIVSYVEHYPRWVDEPIKKAMADQIEQRIMPKLRGINMAEHSDALDQIEKLIATNDTALQEAFHAAREKGQNQMMQQFIWPGLSRTDDGHQ